MMQGGHQPPTMASGVPVRTPESIDRDVRTLQQVNPLVVCSIFTPETRSVINVM